MTFDAIAYGKARYWSDPERFRAENKQRRDARLAIDREGELTRQRFAFRKTKYGINRKDWEALFEAQGRCCAMCKSPTTRGKVGWATDHDHTKKKGDPGYVRGILCYRCNTGLGYIENELFMSQANEYLEKHK